MLKFSPGIARQGIYTEFPHPILVCRFRDGWDFEKMKVPLKDGVDLTGHSRDGTHILIEGQIGSESGELRLTEPEMLTTLNSLRNRLNVSTSSKPFELVLFHDESTSDARYFKDCTTTRFECDLSNQHLYSFAATIQAADPYLYSGLLPVA